MRHGRYNGMNWSDGMFVYPGIGTFWNAMTEPLLRHRFQFVLSQLNSMNSILVAKWLAEWLTRRMKLFWEMLNRFIEEIVNHTNFIFWLRNTILLGSFLFFVGFNFPSMCILIGILVEMEVCFNTSSIYRVY